MKLIQLDKIISFIVLYVGLVFFSPAFAVEVNDLYQAKVQVDSQSRADRNIALKKAMQAVVLKVGGQQSALDNSVIKAAISRYNNYITQFQYDRTSRRASNGSELYLVALFNEDKINQLFQQAELAIWGRLRPQILVWFIEEDGLVRNVLADSSNSSLPDNILSFSQARGLPLNLPLMDLEDTSQLNMSDLWGRFDEPIRQMSSRYLSDAILIIRTSNSSLLNTLPEPADDSCVLVLCETQEQYVMDWTLIADQQIFGKSYEGHEQESLLQQILGDVAENIYQRYALTAGMSNDYVIDVANVENLADYVLLIRFLEDLAAVESATLIEAHGDNRRIKLRLLGSKQALLASLELNKQFNQYIDPLAPPSIDDVPVFYWGDHDK